MTNNNSWVRRKLAVVIMLVMALLMTLSPVQHAYAADNYYATWDEWKEAGNPSSTWNDVADAMEIVFTQAKEEFAAGDMKAAYDCVNNGYYGYYETTGFERTAMGYIAGSRKTEVELQFAAAKSVAKNNGSQEDFNAEVDTLMSMIRTDANVLDGVSNDSSESTETTSTTSEGSSNAAAIATFSACFGIILREGFEAILIVGAIIAYLRKSEKDEKKKKSKLRQVYVGSLVGIVASFGLAWLLDAIKLANTANQEIIEGVTALLAVMVLFYVSIWMLNKSEPDAWDRYIRSRTASSDEKGATFALAFTAFLAVFREGAEVVLFFQPLLGDANRGSVWAGFALGVVVLVFVYLGITFLSIRIPLRPFFTITSLLMFLMSISFLGAGIKELIEGDVFTMISPSWLSWIPTNDVLDVLGIYPTLQTLVPQLILLVVSICVIVRTTKKNNLIHAEAEAKRAAEKAEAEAEAKKAEDEAFEKKVREIIAKVLEEQAVK